MWIINIAIHIKNHTLMPAVCAIINLIISWWKGGKRPCAGAEGKGRAGMEMMGSKVVFKHSILEQKHARAINRWLGAHS